MVEKPEHRRRAVGYIRLPAGVHDAQLVTDAQKKAIEEYAEKNGQDVADWYVEEGHGGASMERPALKKLLAAAEADGKSLGTVLVWKWSRLSRSVEDWRLIKLSLEESGVELVSVSESGNSASAERLLGNMIQAMQEFLREQHREDTRRGIREARRRRLRGE